MNDVNLVFVSLRFMSVVLVRPGVDTVDSDLKHVLK